MTRQDRDNLISTITATILGVINGDIDDVGGRAGGIDLPSRADRWQPVGSGLAVHPDVLRLTPMRGYVYLWLTAYAGRDGLVTVSGSKIARRANLHLNTVSLSIRWLETHGWVHIDRTGGLRSYRYRVLR